MSRRHHGFAEELARLPWPVGFITGALTFVLIRYALPAWMAAQEGTLARAIAAQAGMFAPLAWILLFTCWSAALMAFLGARQRRRLLDSRNDLESLAALGWRDFERLVGEAFRRHGYEVEETGLGGADGGIDLILRRDGRRILVQCKQWRRERVPVNVVREMYGLLAHHRADEVRIAALGGFTAEAERFARNKPIVLIDGPALLAMVREVQSADARTRAATPSLATEASPPDNTGGVTPACPICQSAMVRRRQRRSGEAFLGCSRFPACRGSRPLR